MPTGARTTNSRLLFVLGGAPLVLVCLGVFSWIGRPHSPALSAYQDAMAGLAVVLELLVRAGLPAAAYLLAGVGLGDLFSPLVHDSRAAAPLRAALGLGLLQSLSHGLGWAGLLSGRVGTVVAAGVCVLGLGLLAWRFARGGFRGLAIAPGWILAAAPALALMLAAACNPPGWIWDSEAGGYDALEYHLRLPQEWIRLGRIVPLEHNVYSFLPGYVESAFVHLAAMTAASGGPAPGSSAWGLLAGDGSRAISCQLLSGGIAIFAAFEIACLVLAVAQRLNPAADPQRARWAAGAAASLFLCTPWTIVVGSLAYNDLAVVAFFAAALIAALDEGLGPAKRGAAVGLLIGFACGCKPTALMLAGVPAGLVMLAVSDRRSWFALIGAGAAAGVIATAPWLIRNWLVCGNPVFPFGAAVFGSAHWSAEQVERFRAAHAFHGSLLHRLGLLLLIDPSDPAGPSARGMSHPQWFLVFPSCVAAFIVACLRRERRWMAGLLALAMVVQAIVWLFFTHIQSRFLLPLAVPGCALFGLAAMRREPEDDDAPPGSAWHGARFIPVLLALGQTSAAIVIFAGQRSGNPNALLLGGPSLRTGNDLPEGSRAAALEHAGPELLLNLTRPPGLVYLLGDATPFYYTIDVLYNTTFDRWPLGEAIRRSSGGPAAWTAELRRRGVSLVLINFNELGRLSHSGWADPAITRESLEAWLKSGPRTVRNWPEQGWLLVELPPETAR
jgi:hypothetical protein